MMKHLCTIQASLIGSLGKQTLILHGFEHLWRECQGQSHQVWGGTTETSTSTPKFRSQDGLSEGPRDSEAKC